MTTSAAFLEERKVSLEHRRDLVEKLNQRVGQITREMHVRTIEMFLRISG